VDPEKLHGKSIRSKFSLRSIIVLVDICGSVKPGKSMRRLVMLLLATVLGCRTYSLDAPLQVEARIATLAVTQAVSDSPPSTAVLSSDAEDRSVISLGKFDLAALWNLAVANNPSLREAAAEVEAAFGRRIQAGKYPNPHVAYSQENLGTSVEPAGAVKVEVTQEIVTAGKRRLDVAMATESTAAAHLALLGRKFDVLTRIRRAYYAYLGGFNTVSVNEQTVAGLEQGLEITRKQVEEAKTRPRTDLFRIEALLEEARIRLASSRVNLKAAWQQLASEVGVADLPPPKAAGDFPVKVPTWDPEAILRRVQAVNTDLRRAALEVRVARLEVERARAEAIPNVTVGGGYSHDFAENLQGAIISVDTALPLWDRKQGRIHEAESHWVGAEAAQRSVAARLNSETAAAIARYQVARVEVERLATAIVPRLQESLDLLRRSYQAGAAQTTFADVLSAQQALDAARLTLAERRQALWLAIADLQGLMQLDADEELLNP
jgi:cobalt-zinc-cadmium efflux system outer membrane protein